MNDKIFNLKFSGRRKLTSYRIRFMYIYGTILLLIGFLGLISNNDLNAFYLILAIGGFLNIAYGIFGKELIKEKNYISVYSENIEYKNSFRNPKKIKINDLLDLRIETLKVEFVHNDQRVKSYDFSVFQSHELHNIYRELEKVKANLIK